MPAERPEQTSIPDFLHSLRYQAPTTVYSYTAPVGEIVGMPIGRPRKYPEDDARQRKSRSNQLYEQTPRAKARQKTYAQSPKGRAAQKRHRDSPKGRATLDRFRNSKQG